MNTFFKLLGVTLLASTTNNFVWFALTFWAFLTTKSVISTSIVAGLWVVANVLSSNWFGTLVDHNKKKHVLLGSSITTLIFFTLGWMMYTANPESAFASVSSLMFWAFAMRTPSFKLLAARYAQPTPAAGSKEQYSV